MLRAVHPERSERAQHDSERALSRRSSPRPFAFNRSIGPALRRRPDITDSCSWLCTLRTTPDHLFAAPAWAKTAPNRQSQTLFELPPKHHGYCPGTGRHRIFCQKRSGFHWEATNTARSPVSGAYRLGLPATVLGASRRPQRLVRQPHKILRLQQTGNRNVFVDGLPVKNDRREQRGFAMALVPRDCKKRIGNHESAKASAQNEFTTFLHDR